MASQKVAVSLPEEDVRRLQAYGVEWETSFSAVVRQAVEAWLRWQEREAFRRQYERYMHQAKARKEEADWTWWTETLGGTDWPEDAGA